MRLILFAAITTLLACNTGSSDKGGGTDSGAADVDTDTDTDTDADADDTGSGGDDTGSGGDDTGSGGDDTGSGGDDTGTAPSDVDGDGYTIDEGDCDDLDETINPGATEVCDGVDNDCDDLVDDADDSLDTSTTTTWYLDGDGDGSPVDVPDGTVDTCDPPEGYASADGTTWDCNDDDASVYPGAWEIPDDGIDQDCSGEDLVCDWCVEVEEGGTAEEPYSVATSGFGQLDVVFLLDTTCSMSSTATAMALEFLTITDELDETGLDIAYGLATYDDYAYGSYGYASSGDKPFILRQQVTSDDLLVDDAIDAVEIHYGGDGPESTMEALYQAMTGAGYDQNCDESYDSAADVLPFLADTSDPFLGTAGESYVADTPDGGIIGGMGFREGSLPVIIYATDNYLRDSDAGYGVPGGCPIDASATDVISAAEETGAVLIGIAAGTSTATAQMEALAVSTGSLADTDGDGVADDPLVFSWYSGWAAFTSTVVDAVTDLTSSYEFALVELVVEDDPDGVVSSITPSGYADVAFDDLDDLEFTLNLDVSGVSAGTVTVVTVGLYGDGTLIETQEVTILVPPA